MASPPISAPITRQAAVIVHMSRLVFFLLTGTHGKVVKLTLVAVCHGPRRHEGVLPVRLDLVHRHVLAGNGAIAGKGAFKLTLRSRAYYLVCLRLGGVLLNVAFFCHEARKEAHVKVLKAGHIIGVYAVEQFRILPVQRLYGDLAELYVAAPCQGVNAGLGVFYIAHHPYFKGVGLGGHGGPYVAVHQPEWKVYAGELFQLHLAEEAVVYVLF